MSGQSRVYISAARLPTGRRRLKVVPDARFRVRYVPPISDLLSIYSLLWILFSPRFSISAPAGIVILKMRSFILIMVSCSEGHS